METTKFGDFLVRTNARKIFNFAQIEKGNSVLEIGPGRGAFADICLKNGISYWAIEPNEKMARDLQDKGANVVRSMVPPIPNIGRAFDTVVIIHVLEHMDTMLAALQLIKEIYQLLKPGGRVIIEVPDYMNLGGQFFLNDFTHNYITTWPRLEGLLISAEFEKVKGSYRNTFFRGSICFLTSARVFWLPFAYLHTIFPRNRILDKLYKVQSNLTRRVLISGQKHC